MAVHPPAHSANRIILLGASNLTLSLRLVIQLMQQRFGGPSEILTAVGHGRAYGVSSQMLGRGLPGIAACGLWQQLHEMESCPTVALLTDIGNDILYGVAPERILQAVESCIAGLQQQSAQVVVTNLPMAPVECLSERRYTIFRTLFYLPYIVPFVAAVFIWGGMLNSETGWINEALRWLGVSHPPLWTNSVTWVYPAYVILGIWGIGNGMLIFLSSLQNVPTELYDAAKVDGAGWIATTFNVTFPLISPVIFYSLVLSIVDLFQYFLVPLVVQNGTGAPDGSTMFYNLYLYKTFFVFQNMSYGSAMAWMLFVIILAVTLVLFKTAKYWVYYAGDNSK